MAGISRASWWSRARGSRACLCQSPLSIRTSARRCTLDIVVALVLGAPLACDTDMAIPWPGITITPGQALRALWLRERLRQAFESYRAHVAMMPGAGLQPGVAWTLQGR